MHQELCAYLIRDDGRVFELPTNELLIALDKLRQASNIQGQSNVSEKVAVRDFLHTVKWMMQRSRLDCQASEKAKGTWKEHS